MRRSRIAAGLLLPAGACAAVGGVLGAAELVYHGLTAAGLAYAFGLYGLVSAAAGAALGGLGLLLGALRAGSRRGEQVKETGGWTGARRLAGLGAAICTFGLVFPAAAFFVFRDLWAESLKGAGLAGWAAMLGVLLGACGLAAAGRLLGRAMASSRLAAAVCLAASALALGLGLAASGPGGAQAIAPGRPGPGPPVVIVVADALRADALGAYGATSGDSPALDAFASDAVVFEEAWSSSSWTRPGAASILTGLRPAGHACENKRDRLRSEVETLAERLREQGYAAAASVTNVNLAPVFGLGQGFEPWAYLPPAAPLGAPSTARGLFLVELYRLVRLRFFPGERRVEDYYAPGEEVLGQGERLIESLAGQGAPFFVYLHFMETHDPYFAHPVDGRAAARVEQPQPPVSSRDAIFALYRQELRHLDALFARLVARLKAHGLYERALLVVTADHGEEFADHGAFWHGTSLYRELVRVPLLVRFPRGQGAGTRRSDPVELIDLAPTALALAGGDARDLPGRALQAEPQPERPRFARLSHQGQRMQAVRRGPWKLILAKHDNPRGLPARALFDLAADPEERTNRIHEQPAIARELESLLEAGPRAAPEGEQAEIAPEIAEQLRSLGYTE
ncbi:MAG: sulfatase [Deltaproteobacteria bacterium]|nr:sulfatase [Deltaproteobacteria bacterium]